MPSRSAVIPINQAVDHGELGIVLAGSVPQNQSGSRNGRCSSNPLRMRLDATRRAKIQASALLHQVQQRQGRGEVVTSWQPPELLGMTSDYAESSGTRNRQEPMFLGIRAPAVRGTRHSPELGIVATIPISE